MEACSRKRHVTRARGATLPTCDAKVTLRLRTGWAEVVSHVTDVQADVRMHRHRARTTLL